MATRRPDSSLQDRISACRQPPAPQPLKDSRCRDCQMQDPLPSPTEWREACLHQHDFAPMPNRFSILAELDQATTQTTWAFGFTQASNPGGRRRGKRGGKHNKLKLEAQKRREVRKSGSSTSELCERVAALCLDERPTSSTTHHESRPQESTVPRSSFTFSADAVRNHWAPQFRPNSEVSSTGGLAKPVNQDSKDSATFPRQPERCVSKTRATPLQTDPSEVRCKEAPNFPLSAFLASPPAAARRSASAKPPRWELTREGTSEKQASKPMPTPAQRSAASAACGALSSRTGAPFPSMARLGTHDSRSSSPSPAAQTVSYAPRPASPDTLSSRAAPSAPQLITPPHTASPTLPLTPPSSSPPPRQVSRFASFWGASQAQAPPPLPPRTHFTPCTMPYGVPWPHDETTSISMSTLITAPVTSPYPFITQSKSGMAPVGPRSSSNPEPVILGAPLMRAQTKKEVDDFLELGHPENCWCSMHAAKSIMSPAPAQNRITILRRPPSDESELGVEELAIPKKPTTVGEPPAVEEPATVKATTGDQPLERQATELNTVSPTPISPKAFSGSELDDIVSSFKDVQTPISPDSEEYGWEVVLGGDQYERPKLTTTTDEAAFSEPELEWRVDSPIVSATAIFESEPEIISYPGSMVSSPLVSSAMSVISFPSVPPTPTITPHNSSPEPQAPIKLSIKNKGKDLGKAKATTTKQKAYHSFNPWADTSTSDGTTPTKAAKTSEASSGQDTCPACSECICACTPASTTATTTATDWPTPQEAAKVKRTRRESKASSNEGIRASDFSV